MKRKLRKIPTMNDGPSKIGHDFTNKLFSEQNLSKNVINKSWCPKLIFFNENLFLERFGKYQLSKYDFGTFQ